MISLTAIDFVPSGSVACDGKTYDIANYPNQFSQIGNKFGGDGKKTFATPKLAAPAAGLQYVLNENTGDDDDAQLGQIMLLASFNSHPKGWVPCDGRTLQIFSNSPLFALLGTRFGGNGTYTFQLPKLSDAAEYVHYFICVSDGRFPFRP